MALSTVVAGARPLHRSARMGDNAFQGALALDWSGAGAQSLTVSGSSVASNAFDTVNDTIVWVSPTAQIFVTVAAAPVATLGGAGTLAIPAGYGVPVYVPAGMKIAAIASSATVSLLPALIGTGG